MDLKKLVVLVIKLAGLWLFVSTLIQTVGVSPMAFTSYKEVLSQMLIPTGFSLLVGGICWFFPVTIANTIIKGEPLVEDKAQFFPELERSAIAIVGLYLLYRGLADLTYHYTYEATLLDLFGRENQAKASRHATFVTTYVEIGISLIMIFGARTIVTGLRKAWSFGRRWPPAS